MAGNYTFPHTVRVNAILFWPGATDDILIIKQATTSGDVIVQMKSADGEHKAFYPKGAQMIPYIDYTNSTLSAGSIVVFYIQ